MDAYTEHNTEQTTLYEAYKVMVPVTRPYLENWRQPGFVVVDISSNYTVVPPFFEGGGGLREIEI